MDRLRRRHRHGRARHRARRLFAASGGRTSAARWRGGSRGADPRGGAGRRLLLPLVARAQAAPTPARRRRRAASTRGAPLPTPARRRRRARRRGRRRRAPSFEPPRALGGRDVPYPANAPPITEPVVVTVKLLVDVDRRRAEGRRCDHAAAAAVRRGGHRRGEGLPVRSPARYGGAPVPVEITFTHTFLPPPPPPRPGAADDQGPPRTAVLRGRLVELGTRAPVAGATVTRRRRRPALHRRRRSRAAGSACRCPPAPRKYRCTRPATTRSCSKRRWSPNQELAVTYLVERDRYDPYEIVVVGEQRREEVSRITLRGAEIKQIPGTFGDPFRVIQTLPGVASVVSLLPFPVVRGASPSSTGFLLDGTRVPLLYHLLLGAERDPPRVHRRDSVLSRAARPRPTAATPAASSTGAPRARGPTSTCWTSTRTCSRRAASCASRSSRSARPSPRRPLRLPGLPAGPRHQPAVAVLLGLPAARSTAATPRNGWTVFFFGAQRRARHGGGHRRPQRAQPAAHTVAGPGLSPGRPALSPRRRRARGDRSRVVLGLRPHLQRGHRLHGLDRRAVARRCGGRRLDS